MYFRHSEDLSARQSATIVRRSCCVSFDTHAWPHPPGKYSFYFFFAVSCEHMSNSKPNRVVKLEFCLTFAWFIACHSRFELSFVSARTCACVHLTESWFLLFPILQSSDQVSVISSIDTCDWECHSMCGDIPTDSNRCVMPRRWLLVCQSLNPGHWQIDLTCPPVPSRRINGFLYNYRWSLSLHTNQFAATNQ